MQNKLTDLNNHLFTQIERLNDEDLNDKPEELQREIDRSKALTGLAREVISTGQLLLDAHKAVSDGMFSAKAGPVPNMLRDKSA